MIREDVLRFRLLFARPDCREAFDGVTLDVALLPMADVEEHDARKFDLGGTYSSSSLSESLSTSKLIFDCTMTRSSVLIA